MPRRLFGKPARRGPAPRPGSVLLICALLAALLPGASCAAPPTRDRASGPVAQKETREPLPYILGVNTHHGTNLGVRKLFRGEPGNGYGYVIDDTLSWFRKLGFGAIRTEMVWSEVRGFILPERGSDFPSGLTPVKELLEGLPQGTEVLAAVFASNRSANEGQFPTTPEALSRFASRAAAAARLTAPYSLSPYIELWNEWDIGGGTFPADRKNGTPASYVALTRAAIPAIRAANPNARVVVGALSLDKGLDWARDAIELGMLEGADALSVHVYAHCAGPQRRGAALVIEKLEALGTLVREKTGRQDIPILVTETGWPDTVGPCGFTVTGRIDHTAQLLLWLPKLDFIKGIWIYELKNKLQDQKTLEGTFGLLDFDYRPKPSLCGFTDAVSFLRGATFVRETVHPNGMIEMVYTRRGDTVSALWNPAPEGTERPPYTLGPDKKGYYVCDGLRIEPGETRPILRRPLLVMPENHPWEPPSDSR